MKRILILALLALTMMGLMAPAAFAQAPAPKVYITGLIDQVGTYAGNISSYDNNNGRGNDTQFYGRTRARFDIIGEVGKAKGVIGFEIDAYYGQTGSADSGNAAPSCAATATGSLGCATQGSGSSGSFDLNTDTQSNIEVKWLYTEFPLPLIPVPTVVRLGAQPLGAAATYKLAAYANGDFAGVNIVSTITPNVKLLFTYVAVEEALTGKKDIVAVTPTSGTLPQARGDDLAFIVSAEVTPFKGLDIKPFYSYFYANGVTSGSARQGRGGYSIAAGGPFAPSAVAGGDSVGTGLSETRHTVGLDARFRMGPFSVDPTAIYQFGTRNSYNTVSTAYGNLCSGSTFSGCVKDEADISAWFFDVRTGYQLGPLLLQLNGMYTTGNRAEDTLRKDVNFYQPLNTDTSYAADWGTQILSLGVDYYQIINGGAAHVGLNPGVAIGYDKYGRAQVGFKATYAVTPALSVGAGVTAAWTAEEVDTDSTRVANAGLLPSFVDRKTGRSARPEGESNYLGTEVNAAMTWRFADGLALDVAGGYLFAGHALGHRHLSSPYSSSAPPNQADQRINDVLIGTARVRYTF